MIREIFIRIISLICKNLQSDTDEAEEDIWDDSKLNDAYDKALKIANAEVAKRVAMSTNTTQSKDGI